MQTDDSSRCHEIDQKNDVKYADFQFWVRAANGNTSLSTSA
jgi:hypothetical protein